MNDKRIKLFELVNLYRLESSNVFLNIPTNEIVDFVDMVFEIYENEQTIFTCGNGGNVAICSKFSCGYEYSSFRV